MPVITWLLRWIFLEPIQLPFVLLSMLFALYLKGSKNENKNDNILLSNNYNKNNNNIVITKRTMLVLFSGIFLGLAIFTKIPAVTMVPLCNILWSI
jgi:4-amino-4-deoxy-L-arabinose transferase-like glycosyltransferase